MKNNKRIEELLLTFRITLIISFSMLVLFFFNIQIKAQCSVNNIHVFDHEGLYGQNLFPLETRYYDRWQFYDIQYNSPSGSLFFIEDSEDVFDLKDQFVISSEKLKQNMYIDTICKLRIRNRTFDLEAIYEPLANGLWIMKDSLGIIRAQFYFFNGEHLCSEFFDEYGDMIRSLSFNGSSTATPSIVDKWYFKKKLVRYTLANKEYLITSIYYPDGKLLLELINEFNKNSKRYLFYDRVNKTEINFINIKNR